MTPNPAPGAPRPAVRRVRRQTNPTDLTPWWDRAPAEEPPALERGPAPATESGCPCGLCRIGHPCDLVALSLKDGLYQDPADWPGWTDLLTVECAGERGHG
jgi:hypothetical protein